VKERPHQICGYQNSVTHYQDNGDIILDCSILKEFFDSYVNYGLNILPGTTGNQFKGNFNNEIPFRHIISHLEIKSVLKGLILANMPNLVEYFISYLQLPTVVEDLTIDKYRQVKRELLEPMAGINRIKQKIRG
jgi:hypothetical protein